MMASQAPQLMGLLGCRASDEARGSSDDGSSDNLP